MKEKVKATVISKNNLPNVSRFIPDAYGDHAYHGVLYEAMGAEFGITIKEYEEKYNKISSLIIGLGANISHYDDLPREFLVEKFKENATKTVEIINSLNIGDEIEMIIDDESFAKNRKEKFNDVFLNWTTKALLYAPFGCEEGDYGDGRRTAEPEVMEIHTICIELE